MARKRILVLSASVGSGHNRAAQAICKALKLIDNEAHIEYIDVLEDANSLFRKLYGQMYFSLVRFVPHFVGYLYDKLDKPSSSRLFKPLLRLNLRKFTKQLDQQWDLAICTHFLPAEVIANYRTSGWVNFPLAIVTTDFDAHKLWINNPCERYFVASKDAKINLIDGGVAPEAIRQMGIPIDTVFAVNKTQEQYRSRLGLSMNRPVILQLSGGAGFGPMEAVYQEIKQIQIPLEIVVVTGKNEALRQHIEALDCPSRHIRTVLGFTTAIDEYMGAADVVVTKPGGLTSSETLARGAAVCIVDPIPGQEARNSDFLLENNAAIKINSIATLHTKLSDLLLNRGKLNSLRQNAFAASTPNAAFDISRECLTLIEKA